ncbi:alpha-galactosidase [Microbacterium sp. TPD7012]|uniref:alpha-galactosidase n=1 Tax=Microbacterium sp. TPD7012 TaxID=2171975 RepID=UPI000D511193|nr:alpha-galactosidase [Microbacterium sp. TPD7012]PVE98306.1 alpha-galactosidase [Microbacterium sp. TPD7012]
MTSSISLPRVDPLGTRALAHLRRGGVSVVFAADAFGAPALAHWGRALDDDDVAGMIATATPAVMNSSIDIPRSFSIAAGRAHGWSGTPAIEADATGAVIDGFTLISTDAAESEVQFTMHDAASLADVVFAYRLDAAGILHATIELRNTADRAVDVRAARALLPLPGRAEEVLDFSGRWTNERRPQRSPIHDGTRLRSSRRGRPGHDSALLTMAGTAGFRFRAGEIWAAHLAWSGNQETLVERLPEGAGVHSSVLGTGELVDAGEIRLRPGETYRSPEALFVWSDEGIDGVTARLHAAIRSRPEHPRSPRPLLLNTWEAVYFEHDLDTLSALAGSAAELGIERFVLDDGWFRGRRDDHAGLGDWFVDDEVWPAGLRPLSDRVHERGMQFGLWFEPEMVNPDSDLARTHPDWLLGEERQLESRHQFVLDFSREEVATYVVDRLDAVITEAAVDFVKWDHNRDLHAALGAHGDRRVRAHTQGVYRVLDEIRRRHPLLEIESCASGGARVDLGILARTDRVWASDCNDPVERQSIQRWTQTLLPPELIGSHIGAAESHTTHRHASFSFRAVTALFGHAGLEWDIDTATEDERRGIAAWAALYKEMRGLIHSGVTVRADTVDDGALLHGIVAHDRREALFAWVRTETSGVAHTPRVQIPGLDPRTHYRVRVRDEAGPASRHEVEDPSWLRQSDDLICTGAVLEQGLPLPVLNPSQAMLLHFTAIEA